MDVNMQKFALLSGDEWIGHFLWTNKTCYRLMTTALRKERTEIGWEEGIESDRCEEMSMYMYID